MKAIESVILAITYVFFASIVAKLIIYYFKNKYTSYELGLFFSAIYLGVFSFTILRWDFDYFMLNNFLKAGITISAIQLTLIPILIFIKKRYNSLYDKIVMKMNKML
ncbi:hypothetical protein ACPF7I_09020 [Anoxybacillus sp. D401a]|uniref:Uncharacterized protein n=1 Tax=Anoxybacillus mongoliensis TaxID=452565 RepID=A0A7W8JES1_9BACL|nr:MULTISPECIES: hypothetical protein [Anoxybacillus]MBB5355744.1 hypothetical protein [Anoxybacillus mongoliensis]MCX8001314.1 hypothetical protein [Anoxybacillus mongoliensis]